MGWALALHGGAGDVPRTLPTESREPRLATLRRCLDIGTAALREGRTALDVVELVVRELEDCPHFNAGRGSVLTSDGTVEMEACVMEGATLRCGAVSGLSTVTNAISLARLVMDKTPHIYLAFDGAEAFAREQGVETKDPSHFITDNNIERLWQAKEANRVQGAQWVSMKDLLMKIVVMLQTWVILCPEKNKQAFMNKVNKLKLMAIRPIRIGG